MGGFCIDPYLSLIHLFRNPAKACSEMAGLNPKSKSSGSFHPKLGGVRRRVVAKPALPKPSANYKDLHGLGEPFTPVVNYFLS